MSSELLQSFGVSLIVVVFWAIVMGLSRFNWAHIGAFVERDPHRKFPTASVTAVDPCDRSTRRKPFRFDGRAALQQGTQKTTVFGTEAQPFRDGAAPRSRTLLFTEIFVFYLLLDTWYLTHQMGPDDYINAIMSLYTDWAGIFSAVMLMFGSSQAR